VLPVQLQPVPVIDTSVKPLGNVSATVTGALVDAAPIGLETVTAYAAPLCPCVKLPLCDEATLSAGTAGIAQVPMFCHPLLEFDPTANM
jgi:hypothetical protein